MSKEILMQISGYPELLPNEQIAFNKVIEIIKNAYESSGAVPLETPAVERAETLKKAKENEEDQKEIYGLRRFKAIEGQDDTKDLGLKFDLTVPLARYACQHYDKLLFPFKRYQIQPVWRGERSQMSKGRYRQFYQCDIDTIGDGSLNLDYDAEIPAIIYNIFSNLGLKNFKIRINNRHLLRGLLEKINIVSDENSADVLRLLDSLEKEGKSSIENKLHGMGIKMDDIGFLFDFFGETKNTENILSVLQNYKINNSFEKGVRELSEVSEIVKGFGIPDNFFAVDTSVFRGLDYYTGTIYETILVGNEGIGSICSGGRYDNLASKISSRHHLPGVGISIGISRLFPKLVEQGLIEQNEHTVAKVLVTCTDQKYKIECAKVASEFRKFNIKTEIYFEDKKFSKKIQFANRKGFKYITIIGEEEVEKNVVTLRNMIEGEQISCGVVEAIRQITNN